MTGGAGFIGSHLVRRLRREWPRASVLVIDDLSRGRRENLAGVDGITFVQGDLRSADVCTNYICNAVTVFHLADVVAGIGYIFQVSYSFPKS